MKKLMMMAALAMLSACADTETAPLDTPDVGDELDVRDAEEDPVEDPSDDPDVDEDADVEQDTDIEEDADVEEDADGGTSDGPPSAETALCAHRSFRVACVPQDGDYNTPLSPGRTALRWALDCSESASNEYGEFVDCEAQGMVCVSGVGCRDDVELLDCGNIERERICNSSFTSGPNSRGIQYCSQGVPTLVGLCQHTEYICSSRGLENDSRCVPR